MKLDCPKCHGSGKVPDPVALGSNLRKLRESFGLSLRGVAEEMGISSPYLSDMELGNRMFTEEMMFKFRVAIDRMKERVK